jgi:hypothetical protein
MTESQRRGKRYNNDMTVELLLRDEANSVTLAGPAQCFLRDLSSYGAGLILTQIHFGSKHLFYTPDEQEDTQLFLEATVKDDKRISIPIRPVWFKLDENDDVNYFHMGIEFLVTPKDERISALKDLANNQLSDGKGWLSKMLLKIWN